MPPTRSAWTGRREPDAANRRGRRKGWRFDNCFATKALCSPSRSSILTATYSHINGVSTLATPIECLAADVRQRQSAPSRRLQDRDGSAGGTWATAKGTTRRTSTTGTWSSSRASTGTPAIYHNAPHRPWEPDESTRAGMPPPHPPAQDVRRRLRRHPLRSARRTAMRLENLNREDPRRLRAPAHLRGDRRRGAAVVE